MSATRPKYSFVVPIYKDGALARDFCAAFEPVFQELLGQQAIHPQVELIFVNDGSPDDSLRHLRELAAELPWVRAISLSRNFGQHIAISCGYAHARGDYVGYLNVDQEEPPDQIPLLLRELEADRYDMVVGLRRVHRGSLLNRLTSALFNAVLNYLTKYDGPINEATLRIMNRRFIDAYNSLTERSRFLPGLERWLGFRRGHVEIEHRARKVGRSSYTFRSRLRMATESIISFSDFPLRLASAAGLCISALGLAAGVVLAVLKALGVVDPVLGWTSVVVLVLFLGGLQIGVVGLAGLYIGRVLSEVQGRPLYLVGERIGFEDAVPAGGEA
ncbi:MAG: glycosyltransferase family 2 protein [Planctomycetota bacterium]